MSDAATLGLIGQPQPDVASVSGFPTLAQIRVLISAGADESLLRDIASDAVTRVSHLLVEEYDATWLVREWDYRLDPARETDVGHMADRSLLAVEKCDLVIGVIGRRVGQVTKQEIRRVYELRAAGRDRHLWLFAHKPHSDPDASYAELNALVDEIRRDFDRQIVFHEVGSELDFQASLLMQLIPYALARANLAALPRRWPQ